MTRRGLVLAELFVSVAVVLAGLWVHGGWERVLAALVVFELAGIAAFLFWYGRNPGDADDQDW